MKDFTPKHEHQKPVNEMLKKHRQGFEGFDKQGILDKLDEYYSNRVEMAMQYLPKISDHGNCKG